MSPTRRPDPYGMDDRAAGKDSPSAASRPADPRFDVLERRGIFVITLLRSRVLDAHEIELLGDDLQTFLARKRAAKVILDLHGVHQLSSSALGMLVTLKSTIEGSGGALRLANVRKELQQVFKLTKLDKVLPIKESVDAAAATL